VTSSSKPVAVAADLSDLVVRLQVPEKYFTLFFQYRHQLKAQIILPQDEVRIGVSQEEKVAQGRLDTMAPYIDGASKTFEILFQLEEGKEWFTPGMFVRVKIVFNSLENVLLLPITARKMDGTLYFLEASEIKTDSEAAIQGRLSSWNHQDSVTDNQWIMVPEEFRTTLFVVEGQETVLAGQEVQASVVELSWEEQ
jgi:hypothetical protein